MSYIGFSKLKKMIAKKGGAKDPGAVASSIMRKKYSQKEITKHQQSGMPMKNAPHKKKFG